MENIKSDELYQVSIEDLTVYHIDENGEKWDLNATGQPINSKNELVEFINQLHETDCISDLTRTHLISDIYF